MPKATKYLKVMIGRFQPLHNGHLKCMRAAIDTSDLFIVVIGSANALTPRTRKNPFTGSERHGMIWLSLTPAERAKTVILLQDDVPGGDQEWVKSVKTQVKRIAAYRLGDDVKFHNTLVGCHKGADTYYLALYKGWTRDLIPQNEAMNATDVRNVYFGTAYDLIFAPWVTMVPPAVAGWLTAFKAFANPEYLAITKGCP